MNITSPRDVPDFRLWMIDQWSPGGMFDLMDQVQPVEVIQGERVLNIDANMQRRLLPEADLWWVTEDMTRLVDHSSKTLPETTLTEDLIPADYGLIVFAQPLMGVMYDTGEPISTDAMTWGVGIYHRNNEPGVSITSYHRVHLGDEIGNAAHGYQTSRHDFWAPTGTTVWQFGSDTDALVFEGFRDDDLRAASLSEDRRWLAATWLLASQPLTVSELQRAQRPAAKRSSRANVGSDVRVVDLRPRPRSESGDGEGAARREHDHRWMVAGPNGDGFWRQQVCGPGRSQRRPTWIEPYVAGPADRPLKLRPTVRVLRKDPTE